MFDHYLQAFATVLLPQNLLAMVLGSLWGLLAGALPGISTSMGVVLLFSFTYSLSPMTAFILLVGAYLGGITGGSITSILFGIPGEPSSVPTVIEGHALAKQGRATFALWVYLLCSIYGGLFSVVVMIVATPLIASFALKFGPAEYFALTVLGLSVVSGLSGGSMLKGFLSCFFGLFLATIGTDGITGEERYTFDTTILLGRHQFRGGHGRAPGGLRDLHRSRGTLQGIQGRRAVPGHAAGASAIFSVQELPADHDPLPDHRDHRRVPAGRGRNHRRVSLLRRCRPDDQAQPEKFGKGAVEGLMAAECANNASTGGSMTILLALGIPGSNTTAMMIAAFMIHGMQPGPMLLSSRPDIIYGIFVSMLMSNLFCWD